MSGDFFNKDEQEIIGIAVEQLSSVCDNAQLRDYVGFNRADASVGHHLASLPVEEWTDAEYMYCWTILFKYRNQLEKVFGTTIDNLYQNRLSVLKEKSKEQKLENLTSIKKLKKKDDSHIRGVLKDIGDTLKEYVNGKDIIHYNEEVGRFEITQNQKKHSESFLAAMQWLNAEREDGETFTKWFIQERFREAIAYIIVKLIGKEKCHITKGTLEAIKDSDNPKYDIKTLTKSGFDKRDYIVVHERDNSIDIEIYPRGTYGSFKQMSRFEQEPESFRAIASLIYMKDLKLIKTACSKKNYNIYHNGEDIGFFGIKNMLIKKGIKNPLSIEYVNDTSIKINGEISLLNLEKIEKMNGVSAIKESNSLVIVFESLNGLDQMSRMLKPFELKVTYSKFSSKLLMSNSDKAKEASKKREEEKEIDDMGKSIIVDIDQNIALVRFEYNERYVNAIKSNVNVRNREYNPANHQWKILGARENKKVISFLIAEGFQYRER